ncbi:MAG: hypothetical protein A3K31_07160 [Ignavibacteria bacterium RIFOXYA12_FULL_35_25]|nr:MAG: hypothetical protein A2006_10410 [Ignavibacteria bacterium GWC2_35_8]OGU59368.1 MAG: hypothetical protein A2X60_11100 [Ignavibacteria bacterium GWF2_35_20]OGU86438.1 MAG: hypothetical protein A3K31_07160 [Ignavibacteria bacterium RIFOXYA12_FULL_35_25]OGU92317.1 MAG: hypothetical protein A2492_12885 [Ignavibacteria bacterium RIFOXYC12_FULL_35_11]OGU97687.1 MAG: hypothetical protein A2347_17110 [Ignavibacteria bacterium RIFOXYB12_FULL_35_14]OGV29033.1 MAG: hypothetical protein A2523_1736
MKILICSILFLTASFSQSADEKLLLTGNLANDSKVIQNNYVENRAVEYNFQTNERKSPFLGGIMSLVVPGAGEIYAGEYWKAGIFIAIEAAMITTAIIYDKKGDDKTAEFENYANQNWSAKNYADWSLKYLKENIDPSVDIEYYRGIVFNSDGSVNWSGLNELERKLGKYQNVGYSHTLAPFGDQQYYEMIGKYPQFSHGWNDSIFKDTDYHILSPNFKSYSTMRGKANDLYNVASTAVIGIYVNHFLSALDAAWSVANYNSELAMKMRIEQMNLTGRIELVPTLNFSLSF